METKTTVGQTKPSKLGFTAAAKIVAPTMAGCGRNNESNCGITQKNG